MLCLDHSPLLLLDIPSDIDIFSKDNIKFEYINISPNILLLHKGKTIVHVNKTITSIDSFLLT